MTIFIVMHASGKIFLLQKGEESSRGQLKVVLTQFGYNGFLPHIIK